ncbi:MAG TPA: hypothetical protein VK400_16575 [Pyrinomonadaceae bacterium]|nr:hypothetical protein [Pyrinomonadaceae bacterium]
MLIVRPAQLEAFQPQADAAFETQVVQYLQEEHGEDIVRLPTGVLIIEQPSAKTLQEKYEDDFEQLPEGMFIVEQLPDEILLGMVRSGIARARNYEMSWESSLTAFVVLMFVIAPNFDQHPNIQRVLKDTTIVPDERIDHLWERTSEEDWEKVAQHYDSSAWGIKPVEEKTVA